MNLHRTLSVALISIAIAFSASTKAEETLTWHGCGITKNAFTVALAKAFEEKYPIKVSIRGGGAMKGIRDAASGSADIGGTCRHTINTPEEKNVELTHVAWDALVVIVPASNPVDNLTSQQLRDIFEGKIRNWKELGGNDVAIELYARRGKLSGVGYMFRALFFGDPNMEYKVATELPRSSGLIEMLIGKGEGTIGISGISSAKKRDQLKVLSLDGVSPSKENIQSGRYQLIRPLYFATSKSSLGQPNPFLQFALSDEGQAIISQQGTVNLEEGNKLVDIFVERFGETYLSPSILATRN